MKKILITGAGSYIGTSFENYMKQWSDEYEICVLDLLDAAWRDHSFENYDCVYHVAGIAHRKETKENRDLYYKVNTDLVLEVADKAKDSGVRQFIFLSSMSVYGVDCGVITKDTQPMPKSNYGRSKLMAEEGLEKLSDDSFRVCVLRPPMVYGKGCKGNFNTVYKLVSKLPFFPKVNNKRSMIYIDNLSAFVKLCADRELSGLYFPQNREYVNTYRMAKGIADGLGKKLFPGYISALGVLMMRPFVSTVKKAFGTLIYSDTEDFDFSYAEVDCEESFKKSV